MTKTLLIVFCTFISSLTFCQKSNGYLHEMDIQLGRLCSNRQHHVFSDQRSHVFGVFDSLLLDVAQLSESFHNSFDSLERCIYISFSNDHTVKCYAYDNLEGGSSHTYTNIVSFYNGNNVFVSHKLTPDLRSPMVGFTAIHRIKPKHLKLYLFTGYGTYGDGKQHMSLQLFKIDGFSLTECFDCYEDYSPLYFEQNRIQDFDIEFDENLQQIKAKVYQYNNETGFYTEEFNWVSYSIKDGKIQKMK
ncbi:MAG: hypothetical protein ISR55_09460 [Bacteroidetes bacterium]|nr:hypothetical protein [Bacteroidota bacterium]